MNRSFGERPVRSPVVASKTPCAVSWASPRSTALLCNSSALRFQCTAPLGSKPCEAIGVANEAGVDERVLLSMLPDAANWLSTITDERGQLTM